jgi:hypothetical protein
MTSGNKELLSYVVACIGTFVGLFALQTLVASSQDVAWHADQQVAPANPDRMAVRAAEQQALGTIDQAIQKVAAGERVAPPQPSTDVNALSGWVQSKQFAPVAPFAEPAPAAAPEAAPATGEVPAAPGATGAAPAAPAPAAAAPAAPAAPAPAAPAPAPAAAPTHH